MDRDGRRIGCRAHVCGQARQLVDAEVANGRGLCGNAAERLMCKALKVEASMVFLGALPCRGRTGAIGHRAGLAWAKFWASKHQYTTRALNLATRLQRSHAEILLVTRWGSP